MSRLGPSGLVARRRTVRIILLVVLASTLLVACGDGPVPTTTLPASIPASKAGSEPTDQERAVADALVRFARSENAADLDPVALAEDVSLGLGPELVLTRTPEALAIPENWVLDRPAFRAYAGPFSALEQLHRDVRFAVTVGPHAYCAAPPMPPPGGLEDHRRLSIQPAAPRSCLQWFSVDLFLNSEGTVEAITVDFYEP